MITIGGIPKILEPFFDCLRPHLTKPQFRHLWSLVIAYGVAFGRRNVLSLYSVTQEQACRQKLNDFMVESPWNGQALLEQAALWILAEMKPRKGECLEILIDGSAKRKRGKEMDALGYVREAGTPGTVPGHKFLLVTLRFRGVMLPWSIELYVPKKFFRTEAGKDLAKRTGLRFRTLNEIAAAIIDQMPNDWADFFKVYVLMDSGFCNETVCAAVRLKGFHYICAAQSSRLFRPDHRSRRRKSDWVKLTTHMPGQLRFQGRNVELPPKRRGGKPRRFRLATQTGTMKGIDRVRCVFSKRKSDGSQLTLVTSDLDLSAEEVATRYGWRWEIEVLLKALKQHLGLGDYQHGWFEGALHHLQLSCLAHHVLTYAELQRLGKKERKSAMLQLPSVRELQNRLRADIWRKTLQELRRPSCREDVIFHLERALRLEEGALDEAA